MNQVALAYGSNALHPTEFTLRLLTVCISMLIADDKTDVISE